MNGGLHAVVEAAVGAFALDATLDAAPGEVVAVVGPNGAGKTTLLRALAGLQPLAGGSVALDGEVLDDPARGVFVPPEARRVGVVFQDPLLFPHLDALDNVAFGLEAGGLRRTEARRRASAVLEQVALAEHGGRRPSQLSGGEAQRVALARALAVEPRLLLLDEPLSALDVTARVEVRRVLRTALASFPGVRVLVTHDPVDALALADRIVVLEAGRVVQSGTAAEVRTHPRSRYVADFVGLNFVEGTLDGGVLVLPDGARLAVATARDESGPAAAVVSPRAITLHLEQPHGSARNAWEAEVVEVDERAGRVRVTLAGALPLVAEVTEAARADLRLAPGARVWASVKATEIDVVPE